MAKEREKVKKYSLITGEDTYASQTAQNPATSRKLQSLIPSAAADLARELPEALFATTTLPSKVMELFQYSRNGGTFTYISSITRSAGTVTVVLASRPPNAATWLANSGNAPILIAGVTSDQSFNGYQNATYSEPGGNTYQLVFTQASAFPASTITSQGVITPTTNPINNPTSYFWFAATATALYQWSANTWVQVTAVGTLANVPVFSQIDDLLHMSDGVTNWIFDGNRWVVDGLNICTIAPGFTVVTPTATATITTLSRVKNVVTITFTDPGWSDLSNGSTLPMNAWMKVTGQTDATLNGTFLGYYTSGHFVYTATGADVSPAAAGTIGPLTLSALTNRYYWLTYADDSPESGHEGSSGLISLPTGAITNGYVRVYTQVFNGSITGSPSATLPITPAAGFVQWSLPATLAEWIGLSVFTNTGDGKYIARAKIINVLQNPTGGGLSLVLDTTLPVFTNNVTIAPARTTGLRVYASESESSKVGYLLATVPLSQPYYVDQSPFLGASGSYFQQINRPVRNDPPPTSLIMAVHKYRIFRRREARPNFFNFTANEEVASGANGSPQQSVPGADGNTQSDLDNEVSYPDDSNNIRAMVSHADALYIGTEKQALPLYGESIDDFAISQVAAFSMGFAGPHAVKSSPHGLLFMSYDKKFFLYPTSNYPWAYVPENVNVTDQLIEIGKGMRNKFSTILQSDLWNVRTVYYQYGIRNWAVVSFQDNTNTYYTYAYDFETKGWFQLQRGFSSLAVFEPTPGVRILVGGGTDGKVYVVDDVSGTYVGTGNLPAATWRTALIDFGAPDFNHIPVYVDFEVSNPSMLPVVNFYLDPLNVDALPNPTGRLNFSQLKIGANKFRAFFPTGVTCNRLLLEFAFPSDTNSGKLRGVLLASNQAPEVL